MVGHYQLGLRGRPRFRGLRARILLCDVPLRPRPHEVERRQHFGGCSGGRRSLGRFGDAFVSLKLRDTTTHGSSIYFQKRQKKNSQAAYIHTLVPGKIYHVVHTHVPYEWESGKMRVRFRADAFRHGGVVEWSTSPESVTYKYMQAQELEQLLYCIYLSGNGHGLSIGAFRPHAIALNPFFGTTPRLGDILLGIRVEFRFR